MVYKKYLETGFLLNRSLSFKAYKTYITAILFLKLYKNKNIRFTFKARVDAADKGKMQSMCSIPELSKRNFCDGLEIKFTSPQGQIQQAGASEAAEKSVIPCFTLVIDYKRLDTRLYFIITSSHTKHKPQENVSHYMNSPIFTLYTTMVVGRGGAGGLGSSLHFEI